MCCLKPLGVFSSPLQTKSKLLTGAHKPYMVWSLPMPPNLISFHAPAPYVGFGSHGLFPAQGFHICCSPCLELCSSCTLHSWLPLILRASAQMSPLRECFPGHPICPPATYFSPSSVYSLTALNHALKLSYLYNHFLVYILCASQKNVSSMKPGNTSTISIHHFLSSTLNGNYSANSWSSVNASELNLWVYWMNMNK